MKLIVSGAAAADLVRLQAFIGDKNDEVAQRAAATLGAAMPSLLTFSERGRPSDIAGLRELIVPFGRSAYVLRYKVDAQGDEVVIVRVWHGREGRE
jgi:plasmid stabilization system protein ParE